MTLSPTVFSEVLMVSERTINVDIANTRTKQNSSVFIRFPSFIYWLNSTAVINFIHRTDLENSLIERISNNSIMKSSTWMNMLTKLDTTGLCDELFHWAEWLGTGLMILFDWNMPWEFKWEPFWLLADNSTNRAASPVKVKTAWEKFNSLEMVDTPTSDLLFTWKTQPHQLVIVFSSYLLS